MPTERVNTGLARMLKGGVIMDVVTAEQAKIAEDAGAVAVMALERVPADIRSQGGVARMSDPDLIDGIIDDRVDPGDGEGAHRPLRRGAGTAEPRASTTSTSPRCSRPPTTSTTSTSSAFDVPFVCGATNLGEALRRITEGAAMIRSKGEAGTGDVSEAMKPHPHRSRARSRALGGLARTTSSTSRRRSCRRRTSSSPRSRATGELPVVLFVAGGVATPADAAMMMQLGADGVFVGSGIFKSGNPAARAKAIVKATTFHDDCAVIAEVSRGLGEAMVGINVSDLPAPHRLAERGW